MHNIIIEEDICRILEYPINWDKLDNSVILVSGADSFMMSYFIYSILTENRMHNRNIKIVGICRNPEHVRNRFADCKDNPQLEIIIQDMLKPISYDGPVDYCIHAASPAGIESRQKRPLDTYEVNVEGCKNLINICKRKKTRNFLLLSSVDVYGKLATDSRLQEADIGSLDWNYSRNAYSVGKRSAETICTLNHIQDGFPCVIVRPFQVYGPGMSLTDGRLHGNFIGQLLDSGRIVLKSDGTAIRSFLYLADATTAIVLLLTQITDGGIYNVCDEAGERSVSQLAELYADKFQAPATVEYSRAERNSVEVREAPSIVTGSSEKLRNLGWIPHITLDEGIARTLAFYTGEEQ